MQDIQQQLADLRQRIARIQQRERTLSVSADTEAPPPAPVEHPLTGHVVTTPHGEHFETERLYPHFALHGSASIGDLAALAPDLLHALSDGEMPACPPEEWAFLDTETTGLAGGTGTLPFLIGVGRITRDGFYVRHFFLRDHADEASALHALTQHLAEFQLLITYNGRSYDQPLLETRYRLARQRPPFSRLPHLDLLYGARRLWKLRLDNCRLVTLEHQILGLERIGDIAGELIPYVYFDYLRHRDINRLLSIFHHNAIDILSLACLTAVVPCAFQDPHQAPLRHGSDTLGLARWLRNLGRQEEALTLLQRALQQGLSDTLTFRTLWELGSLAKKLERTSEAIDAFTELSTCRNAHQVDALEELAKHHEHATRDYARALAYTLEALDCQPSPALQQRAERLRRRLQKSRTPRLIPR